MCFRHKTNFASSLAHFDEKIVFFILSIFGQFYVKN